MTTPALPLETTLTRSQACLDRAHPDGEACQGLRYLQNMASVGLMPAEKLSDVAHIGQQLRAWKKLWTPFLGEAVAIPRVAPDGRKRPPGQGRLLPEAALQQVATTAKRPEQGMNFLRLAAYYAHKSGDAALVRWALRSGFSANRFEAGLGCTPLGQAAYAGWPGAVQAMLQAGAEPLMPLLPEHLRPNDSAHLLGSTLLHRLLRRGVGQHNTAAMVEVVQALLPHYPRPLPALTDGTPLLAEAEEGPMLEAVRAVLARESAHQLTDSLTQDAPRPRKLRL